MRVDREESFFCGKVVICWHLRCITLSFLAPRRCCPVTLRFVFSFVKGIMHVKHTEVQPHVERSSDAGSLVTQGRL